MSSTGARNRHHFDPRAHRADLVAIVRDVVKLGQELGIDEGPLPAPALHRVLRRHPRDGRGFFSRAQLIEGFRAFAGEEGFGISQERFVERVQLKPTRTLSGVTPVTVFTRPHPCPGRCVFCPSDVRMPKSYLSREPGCQRAEQNAFDPYLQTYNRLRAFVAIGHPVDKVELIVLGGTFTAYPREYQRWFVVRCLEALNDFGSGRDARSTAGDAALDFSGVAPIDGRAAGASYNHRLTRHLRVELDGQLTGGRESAGAGRLGAAQRSNETAACRNVGLSVETRPDEVDEATVLWLRGLGCTKVQLGYQSASDRVLTENRRGHDVEASRLATDRLRRAGFKVHAHWMANLLGSTPAEDRRDFDRLFEDPGLRPDELKVYPCSLIESADLMADYEAGRYRPYTEAELLEVVEHALSATPRYCRLTRVIRDISANDIVVGNRLSNLRELAATRLTERGVAMIDIRAREVREAGAEQSGLSLRCTSYRTRVGTEHFLELVTDDDRLAALLRLALPDEPSFVRELGDAALIRELHVYGESVALGRRAPAGAQHRGLGARLIDEAAALAARAGVRRLSVISAIGTRGYYRGRGFADGELYQHLTCPS